MATGPGRPTKLTPGIQQAICETLRKGNTRRCACALAHIHPDTFYSWFKDNSDFSDAVISAEGEAEKFMLSCITNAAPKSWQAAAWYLERRKALEYNKRETHDVNITNKSDSDLASIVAGALELPDGGSADCDGGTGEAVQGADLFES